MSGLPSERLNSGSCHGWETPLDHHLQHSELGYPCCLWLGGCVQAGWIATEFGVHFPGAEKYFGVGPVEAHNALVKSGDLIVALHIIGFLEVIGGVGIYEMSKGSDRQPGEFGFDPLNLGGDKARRARYQLSEIKNGRLAMLAFGGIATQAVLTGKGFPYF